MISEELLRSFISEASDLLDDIEQSLVKYPRLDNDQGRVEILNRVFRHFHSIKGSAGFVGLHDIARITHEAETLLEQFRKFPDRIIPQTLIVLFCRTIDVLRAIFANNGKSDIGGDNPSIEALITEISGAIKEVKGKPGQNTARKPLARGGSDTAALLSEDPNRAARDGGKIDPLMRGLRKSSDTTARVIHTQKMDTKEKRSSTEFRQKYVTEANELLEQAELSLLQAEQHPESSSDDIQEALRCLHSFKGNNGFMGLADLERLSHRMETEIESSIGRSLGLDSQTFDVLLQMIDVLRQGVMDFSCGGSGSIPEADSYIAMMDEFTASLQPGAVVHNGKTTRMTKRAETGRIDASPPLQSVSDPAAFPTSPAGPEDPNPESGSRPTLPSDETRVNSRNTIVRRKEADETGTQLQGDSSRQEDLRSLPKAKKIDMSGLSITPPAAELRAAAPLNPDGAPAAAVTPGQAAGGNASILSKTQILRQSDIANRQSAAEQIVVRNDIRVDLRKLDSMLDLVGELVIAEAMVTRHSVVRNAENESLERAVHQLRRVASSLQDTATFVRMIPLAPTFRRMTRLVYDLSVKAGKQIDLVLMGEDTEVDRTVIERISDPLVHIIRNAVDHGIELPRERAGLGKSETGRLTIEGHHEGGEVWIVITDDGRGLNKAMILEKAISRGLISGNGSELTDNQIYHFIFEPGFSTASKVTDISGRGFGMDVVKKNIEKLSGRIDIRTRPGEGTAVVLRIPLTLAIIDGMLISSGGNRYIIPLLSIRESLRPDLSQIFSTPDGQEVIKLREELIPIVKLDEIFSRVKNTRNLGDGILMIVEGEYGDVVALFADELLGQQETVIKGLSGWLKKSRGVSGCTILGDGEVGLILDIGSIVALARQKALSAGALSTVTHV